MGGNITNELVSKLGMKNLSKGVKVTVLEGVVTVDLTLNIDFGKKYSGRQPEGSGQGKDIY